MVKKAAEDKIKVLVMDQSVVYRQLLSEILVEIPGVEVTAVAANGRIALAKMAHKPVDLILFDVEIDKQEALQTLKTLRENFEDVGVVPLCGLDSRNAGVAIKALEMGALEILAKPDPYRIQTNEQEFLTRFESVVRAHWGKKQARRAKRLTRPADFKAGPGFPNLAGFPATFKQERSENGIRSSERTDPSAGPVPRNIDVVAIGISTGGPKALGDVIPLLADDLDVPILLVQHMPPRFTEALAQSLDSRSALKVREAGEGEIIQANTVYIAPGGRHMSVALQDKAGPGGRRLCIALNSGPPVNSCRPSADVLFESLARVYSGNMLAVIMTGMGNDGVSGVRKMKQKGCVCLTQSEDSCVVYGMPRAVDEAGLSDEQVHLRDLASKIYSLVKADR